MHYGGRKNDCIKWKPNTPYMTLKPSGQEIPENKELSQLDIITLKEFYAPPITSCKSMQNKVNRLNKKLDKLNKGYGHDYVLKINFLMPLFLKINLV